MIILARKLVRTGNSLAVIMPPEAQDNLMVKLGDMILWDLTVSRFAVLSFVAPPPYITNPDLFSSNP